MLLYRRGTLGEQFSLTPGSPELFRRAPSRRFTAKHWSNLQGDVLRPVTLEHQNWPSCQQTRRSKALTCQGGASWTWVTGVMVQPCYANNLPNIMTAVPVAVISREDTVTTVQQLKENGCPSAPTQRRF